MGYSHAVHPQRPCVIWFLFGVSVTAPAGLEVAPSFLPFFVAYFEIMTRVKVEHRMKAGGDFRNGLTSLAFSPRT